MARRLGDDAVIAAVDGMLALPAPDAPIACVFLARGAWIAEIAGEARPASDGDLLQLAGHTFALHLPGTEIPTAAAAAVAHLEDVAVSLRVSRDEEQVEITVTGRGAPRVLPPRSHHYTLLTLARARLRDDADAALVEPQRGWMLVDDLCRALAMDENRLNVEIYRIRRDFAAMGLADATAIVERRRGSRLLRLGTVRFSIASMT